MNETENKELWDEIEAETAEMVARVKNNPNPDDYAPGSGASLLAYTLQAIDKLASTSIEPTIEERIGYQLDDFIDAIDYFKETMDEYRKGYSRWSTPYTFDELENRLIDVETILKHM